MVRGLLACLLTGLLVMPVGTAVAAPGQVAGHHQQTATAPPGPSIDTPPSEQSQADSRQKLVIGISAVVLLGIVILGHRARRKRAKKDSG